MLDTVNERTPILPLTRCLLSERVQSRLSPRRLHNDMYSILTLLVVVLLTPATVKAILLPDSSYNSSVISASIKIVRDIRLNHSHPLSEEKRIIEYEKLINSCLSKISNHLERCVQKFNQSIEEHSSWIRSSSSSSNPEEEEKVRRYCCVQNDFKDCWTASIRARCSEVESRLTKWLPLQMLTDLRTDHRCSTFVLYPHKCRVNTFSLWQILSFLLLIPFVAFAAILLLVISLKPEIAYQSLTLLRTHQRIDDV